MAEKYRLFEFVVLTHEPDGSGAEIVVGPDAVVAKDEAEVRILAARAIPAEVDLRAVEILVRPFV